MTKLYLNNDEDVTFKASEEVYTDENGAKYGVDTDEHDKTYENESTRDTTPMVQLSLKEYDALKDQTKYITDPTLIGAIDKIEFFVKELRKHIVRKY